jgi:hypothetical protein
MVLRLDPNKDVQLLIKLYGVKKGTLKEISNVIGVRYTSGKIYDIKEDLISCGILIEDGAKKQRIGFGEKETSVYRVDHSAIDRFLVQNYSPAKKIYQRIYDGKMQILPRLDKEFLLKRIFKLIKQKINRSKI